jgi:ankyrin repeat protein
MRAGGGQAPSISGTLIEHNADIHIRTMTPESHRCTRRQQVTLRSIVTITSTSCRCCWTTGRILMRGDKDDATPLHHSSWWTRSHYARLARGQSKVRSLLLKHGAIIDAEDDEGRTPLQLALEHGRHDIAACLLGARCYAAKWVGASTGF